MAAPAPIGGFFGLEPGQPGQGAQADFGQGQVLLFWNARAALAHLLSSLNATRVWVPAYICRSVVDAAARDGREVRFYGVGDDLRPKTATITAGLRTGDAVFAVDYFGAPAPGLADLAARFPDVAWVEDCAQALWPVREPWGDHVIYSPRKVMGAPDGGVLVSRGAAVPPPAWAADTNRSRLEPARLRAADPDGRDNATWYPAFQAAEAAMTCAPIPMSDIARAALSSADIGAMAARRRANAEALLARVGEAALLPAARLLQGAPLGVPVLTEDAARVVGRMAQARVFCARHWADLPSPAADFPEEHALSARLITLPCDHRYGESDMDRVADAFLALA